MRRDDGPPPLSQCLGCTTFPPRGSEALCSSAFDCTFFCTRGATWAAGRRCLRGDYLSRHLSRHVYPPLAYGFAATGAVLMAYPLDTAVSRRVRSMSLGVGIVIRMLIVPPEWPVKPLRRLPVEPTALALRPLHLPRFSGLPRAAGTFRWPRAWCRRVSSEASSSSPTRSRALWTCCAGTNGRDRNGASQGSRAFAGLKRPRGGTSQPTKHLPESILKS